MQRRHSTTGRPTTLQNSSPPREPQPRVPHPCQTRLKTLSEAGSDVYVPESSQEEESDECIGKLTEESEAGKATELSEAEEETARISKKKKKGKQRAHLLSGKAKRQQFKNKHKSEKKAMKKRRLPLRGCAPRARV